jgi:hypothetical protein
MFEAMKKFNNMNEQQCQEMGVKFDQCMQHLATEFGFKGETKFEGEKAILSFTK